MANQFNNQKKCSKCGIEWDQDLGPTYSLEVSIQRRIFNKNGKDFCFSCLVSGYNVNCRLCYKRINSKDELGCWAGVTAANGVYNADADHFDFRCLGCSKKKYNPHRPINPGENNTKKCRIAGCSQESYYPYPHLCKQHSRPCQGTTSYGKKCNLAIGIDEGDFCKHCKNQNETYQQQKDRLENEFKQSEQEFEKDKSSSPSSGLAPQAIVNSNGTPDNSANPENSPQMNPGKDKFPEAKSNVKTIRFENKENNSQNNSAKSNEDDKVQIINPRSVKQIILTADGKLVIEFNSEKLENGDSISQNQQVITSEQIDKNKELQKIKNYCQRNNKSALNQQELNSILAAANSTATESPKKGNNVLLIGGGIGVALVAGIVIGLLLKKRKIKKS